MLRKLSVENYALIDSLELELGNSLNIITGETGAGKSILLGALGLLLGNRAEAAALKDSGRNCVVEGIFEVGNYGLEPFFLENDLEYDPQTVIRRVISPGGKSRSYVNDLPVQQATLRELGERLIDIHSQHQSLMLAEDGFRTGVLDSVAGNRALREEYRAFYDDILRAERELTRLREEADRIANDREWLEYQAGQLRDAALADGEQEELEAEQGELTHAEEIQSTLGFAVSELDADETGIFVKLKSIRNSLSAVAPYYQSAQEFSERVDSTLIELRDIARSLASEAGRIESDPGRLNAVNERLAVIYSLQQKHKAASVAELLAVMCGFEARLAAITGSGEAIAELESRIAGLRKGAVAAASKITASRREAARKLTAYVEDTLAGLGIPAGRFIAEITPAESLRPTGMDNIRFLFSANKNVAPAPVEKIASGGEISRLMLALKSLIARSASLPTIIFDEIDSGVSGHVADSMGRIIEGLAATMQVINITHLPQVASKGDVHFVVYKDDSGASAQTRIMRLDADQRVGEIAKMLSGSTVTEAAITQAKLLLGKS